MNRIGIDLGGTKIEAILLDQTGKTLRRERIPTNRGRGYNHILRSIRDLVRSIQPDEDYTVGLCTPGAISPFTGRLRNSNTVCLIDKPIREDLEILLSRKVHIENDANCFALAEAILGAGQGHAVVLGVIMGTGVGGGIVINGKIHQGRMHIAGEWGHMSLIPDGRECYCGMKGCVETVLSGPSLEGSWEEKTGRRMTLKEIADILEKDKDISDPMIAWKNEILDLFGRALGNVVTLVDPDVVVLGGGVSHVPFLYTDGVASVRKYTFSDSPDTPIIKNTLGDSGGVFGAALLPEIKQ